MTAEQNYRLLQEIDANRRFILMAYLQNPKLLERADAGMLTMKRISNRPKDQLDIVALEKIKRGEDPNV
jgi:hypothetical protein